METNAAARRRLRPDDRRVLLMQAAARTFARLGFAGARMEDVAAEAGVAKGLLYRHFPSKEELFQSLMDELGADFTARLRRSWTDALATDDASPWNTVDAGLNVFLDEASSPDTMLNWVEPAQWQLVARFRDQTLQAVADELSALAPELPADMAWLIAALFQGALEGGVLEWRRRGRGDRDMIYQLARAFVLRGLDGVRTHLELQVPEVPTVQIRRRGRTRRRQRAPQQGAAE